MDLSHVAWRKSSHSGANGGSCVEVGVWRKSSHSGNGGEDCIEVGIWRKSGRSHGNGGDCVEVAAVSPEDSPLLLVRDSKDPAGPKLSFSGLEWATFLAQIKTGSLNLTH